MRSTSIPTSRRKRRGTTRAMWRSCAGKWKARWWCWVRPRLAGKFLQCAQGQISRCWKCRRGWMTKRCRSCAWWICGRKLRKEKGIPIFSQQLKEAHSTAARTEGTNDPVFEPARLFHFVAMSALRLCGGMPELQRLADLSSAGAKAALPYLRSSVRPAPPVCPECEVPQPGNSLCRASARKRSRTRWRNSFRTRAFARMDSDTLKRKDDYRRILGDFRTGKIDILVGTQMIAKGLHFPNVTLVGIIYADLASAHAGFPRGRTDVPVADASGGTRGPRRCRRRSFRAGVYAVSSRRFNLRAGTISPAFTNRRSNFASN